MKQTLELQSACLLEYHGSVRWRETVAQRLVQDCHPQFDGVVQEQRVRVALAKEATRLSFKEHVRFFVRQKWLIFNIMVWTETLLPRLWSLFGIRTNVSGFW